MGTWDDAILNEEANVEFLDDLAALEFDEVLDALDDTCLLVVNQVNPTEEEVLNAQAAATLAAIFAGAPYSAGEVVEAYPFIRELIGETTESLKVNAAQVLEEYDGEHDLEAYLEALE